MWNRSTEKKNTLNDLFSSSFSRYGDQPASPARHDIEMGTAAPSGVNLCKFFEDVESVKEELNELERLNVSVRSSHEQSKTLHNAKAAKDIRFCMDNDVCVALKKAKLIQVRSEALDRSSAANRSLPDYGTGSSADRTRTSVVNGQWLAEEVKRLHGEFQQSENKFPRNTEKPYNVGNSPSLVKIPMRKPSTG